MDIVDGYSHCGRNKYLPVADLTRVMDRFGVARAVLVQHLGEYDNSYIESIVSREPSRFAGVFLVDVERPAAIEDLANWASGGVFRGVRLLARTLETHPQIWRRAAALGLNIVVYDEPTIARYAAPLARFAADSPATRFVLSHLGMPDLRQAPDFASHQRILSLAQWENVFVQISGMHMFAKPPYGELIPIVEALVTAFGVRRLLYGSNFPVMQDEALYGQEIELIRTGRLGILPNAAPCVLGETAMEVWFNKVPRTMSGRPSSA